MLLFNYGRLKRFYSRSLAYSVLLKCYDEWQGRKRKHLLLHWCSTKQLQNTFVWSSRRDNNQLYMFVKCDNKILLMFQRFLPVVFLFCRSQGWGKCCQIKILSFRVGQVSRGLLVHDSL
jgi:hypothetical protein